MLCKCLLNQINKLSHASRESIFVCNYALITVIIWLLTVSASRSNATGVQGHISLCSHCTPDPDTRPGEAECTINMYLINEGNLKHSVSQYFPCFCQDRCLQPFLTLSGLISSSNGPALPDVLMKQLPTSPANPRSPQGHRAGNGLHIVSDVPDHEVIMSEIMSAWLTPNSFTHSITRNSLKHPARQSSQPQQMQDTSLNQRRKD